MKKLFLIIICVCFCFMSGCETETELRCAYISEMTGALSTDYAIKVVLDEDDRTQDKYVDLQIMSDKEEQILSFGQEGKESFSICLPKSNYWYNLTYLVSKTNGANAEGGYEKYEDFGNRIYLFSAQNDVELNFRIVVGDKKTNQDSGEEILVLSEPVSEEVKVSVKKHQEK